MKPAAFPSSLRWKILGWFFLNLALIGGAVFLLLRAQFRFGVNTLLAGPTGDRLEAIAAPLAAELRRLSSEGEWNDALTRATALWRERGVRAVLIRGDGQTVAGEALKLPAEVRAEIRRDARRPPRPPRGQSGRNFRPPDERSGPHGSGEGQPPPAPPGDGGPDGPRPPRDFRPPPGGPPPDFREPPGDRGEEGAASAEASGPLPKFMIVTDDPRLYWAGVRLGEFHSSGRGGPPPVTLLLASHSLSGGGLFFDYAPWLALGGGLVLLSVLLWLPFVQQLTGTLAEMTRTAEAIAQGRFEPPRVNGRRDELGRLGRALAHMATRLEGFVTGQKRFLGDTAHELLSPLARLEVALSILEERCGKPGGGDQGDYAQRALGEVRYLSGLVHDLLSFSKAGLRTSAPAKLQTVALAVLVREAVARETAEETNVIVQLAVAENLCVLAEPGLLSRAIGNVVRNAVRYAGDAGPIEIAAATPSPSEVSLTISDRGPGVPADALDRLFDPFFRPESARTRETGGTGLGLAIVKSCVEACGGRVEVSNRQPSGLQLVLTLQRAA